MGPATKAGLLETAAEFLNLASFVERKLVRGGESPREAGGPVPIGTSTGGTMDAVALRTQFAF